MVAAMQVGGKVGGIVLGEYQQLINEIQVTLKEDTKKDYNHIDVPSAKSSGSTCPSDGERMERSEV